VPVPVLFRLNEIVGVPKLAVLSVPPVQLKTPVPVLLAMLLA